MKKHFLFIFLSFFSFFGFSDTLVPQRVLDWISKNGDMIICSHWIGSMVLTKDDNGRLFIYANKDLYLLKSEHGWAIYAQDEILYKEQIEKAIENPKINTEIEEEGYIVYSFDYIKNISDLDVEEIQKNKNYDEIKWGRKYFVKTPDGKWFSVSKEIE